MLIHSHELEKQGQRINWLTRLLRHWRNAIETRRAMRFLSAANDLMLKDIGISRGDIEWVVRYGRPRAKPSEGVLKADDRG